MCIIISSRVLKYLLSAGYRTCHQGVHTVNILTGIYVIYWVSVSEPQTNAFNVEFCLYSMYICQILCHSQHGWLSWPLISHSVTGTMCAY